MADSPPQRYGRDALLLAQVAQGELDALQELFGVYQKRVYQLAMGITGDAETAEEVVQDTFYRLYSNAAKLDAALLLPWLYRVAANLSYNRARAHRRWMAALQGLADLMWDAPRPTPEVLVEQWELRDLVRDLLANLPPRHRAVLVLHYMGDYNIQEVAAILHCPAGTVKSRLYHARRLLKEQLQARYGLTAPLLLDRLS